MFSLASTGLAAVASIIGKIPTMDDYMQQANEVYRHLNFNEMENYTTAARAD